MLSFSISSSPREEQSHVTDSNEARMCLHTSRGCVTVSASLTRASTQLLKPRLTQIFPHRDVDMGGMSRFRRRGRVLKNISLVLTLQGSYLCTACNTPKRKQNLKSHHMTLKLKFMCKEIHFFIIITGHNFVRIIFLFTYFAFTRAIKQLCDVRN